MSMGSGRVEALLSAAEKRVRSSGYNAVSFRDLAGDVGIKSASVHYHFPTKEDLAAAVARAYTERHMAALGDPQDPARAPADLIALYVDLFRRELIEHRLMCLCGVLATETSALPPSLNAEARVFFERNLAWLEAVIARAEPKARHEDVEARALRITALLEGAMLVAHSLGDGALFDAAVGDLTGSSS